MALDHQDQEPGSSSGEEEVGVRALSSVQGGCATIPSAPSEQQVWPRTTDERNRQRQDFNPGPELYLY